MRWRPKKIRRDKRIIRKFLFLPTQIRDTEKRWLEFIYVIQECYQYNIWSPLEWKNISFASKEDYLFYKEHGKLPRDKERCMGALPSKWQIDPLKGCACEKSIEKPVEKPVEKPRGDSK